MKTPGIELKDARTDQAVEEAYGKRATVNPCIAFRIDNNGTTERLRAALAKDGVEIIPDPSNENCVMVLLQEGDEVPLLLEGKPWSPAIQQIMGPKELMDVHNAFAISEPNGDEAFFSRPNWSADEGEAYIPPFGSGKTLVVCEADTNGSCTTQVMSFGVNEDHLVSIQTEKSIRTEFPEELMPHRATVLTTVSELEFATNGRCVITKLEVKVGDKNVQLEIPPELARFQLATNEAMKRAQGTRQAAIERQDRQNGNLNGSKPRRDHYAGSRQNGQSAGRRNKDRQ